jgi:hypothetical protein
LEQGFRDTTEKEPALVTTAKEILVHRISTCNNTSYKNSKAQELEKLSTTPTEQLYETSELHGLLGEAIFLNFIRESDIDIKVGTGEEDMAGIDFYLNGFPMDITTGFNSVEEKVQASRFATLYIPRHYGQKHVFSDDENFTKNKTYLMDHIQGNFVNKKNYLYDLLTINLDVLKNIRAQIDSPTPDSHFSGAGINNEKNLATLIKILINSNLWPKTEKRGDPTAIDNGVKKQEHQ